MINCQLRLLPTDATKIGVVTGTAARWRFGHLPRREWRPRKRQTDIKQKFKKKVDSIFKKKHI